MKFMYIDISSTAVIFNIINHLCCGIWLNLDNLFPVVGPDIKFNN